MQKKQKIVNPTKKSDKQSKKQATIKWEDPAEYRHMRTYEMMPAQSQVVDRFFFEFNLAAQEDEELLFLSDFLRRNGIARQTWDTWKEKSAFRQQLHTEAMEYIGARRERGALKRQFAEKTVHFMMPHYSQDWKKQQQEQAKLGLGEEKPQNINIIMESYKEE